MTTLLAAPISPAPINPLVLVGSLLRYHRARNYHHAQELCQKAGMKMASASAHGTHVEHPFAYLGTCLSSVICDEARESKTEINTVDVAGREIQDRTDQFERLATVEAVRFTLSELTAVQRAVLLSHGAYEMTFEQIARELGCSPATAYRLWRRARTAFAAAYSLATGESKTPSRAAEPPQRPEGGRLCIGAMVDPAQQVPPFCVLLRKAA